MCFIANLECTQQLSCLVPYPVEQRCRSLAVEDVKWLRQFFANVQLLHLAAPTDHKASRLEIMATFSPALGSKTCAVSSSTFQFLAAADTKPAGSGSSLQVWTDLSGSWQEHTFQEHTTPFGSVLVAQVPISREGALTYSTSYSRSPFAWSAKVSHCVVYRLLPIHLPHTRALGQYRMAQPSRG